MIAKEQSLILLRGLPGSGKTTLAIVLSENGTYPLYSIDDYFTNKENNIYSFDYKQNHLAYKQCEENVIASMQKGVSKIFVHNTFTIAWEMEPYIKLAAMYHYKLFVVTVENYHNNTNTHDVSDEQLQKMAAKYKVKLL